MIVVSMQPEPWPEPDPQVAAAIRGMYRRRELPLAVQIRDSFGELFPDVDFAGAFGMRGRPGWSPGRLAMVTVLQKIENLGDRQAADMVRENLAWKYLLGLTLDDPGFDFSILSEFRDRVIGHGLEERVLDVLLERLAEQGLIRAGGKARTDSTHVVSAVRDLNRGDLAGESVRAAVEVIVAAAPDWFTDRFDVAGWSKRYGRPIASWRAPTSASARAELMVEYGRDGFVLLAAVYAPGSPSWLAQLPAVQVLRTVLLQNFTRTVREDGSEVVKRREADTDGLPPAPRRVTSPYDLDARWAAKGDDLFWNGYKIHVTEQCEDPAGPAGAIPGGGYQVEAPNIIVNVATTDATVPDALMTAPIHADLARRELTPAEHYLDSGYPSAELVVSSLSVYGIALVTPLLADTSAQARAGAGYDRASFSFDFDTAKATCPQGSVSSSWSPCTQHETNKIVVTFAASTCGPCPVRALCTTRKRGGRQLTVPPREIHEAQVAARTQQGTRAWQAKYARRAGVEGTIRQGVAVTGMRRARYRSLAKTHLDHVYSAVALNLIRLDAHWNGHVLDRRRTTHLARLELALTA